MTRLIASVLLFSFSFITAYSQKIKIIEQQLESYEKELGFTGVVLVSQGDSILLHKGYGSGDVKEVPIDKNTVYNIASVTKAFTALAILKLAEQQKLSLQDSIEKYFSNISPDKAGITIHQLLVHQSGLPQTYAAEGENDADKAAKNIFKIKSEMLPGKFIYSNGNYTLLAIIIEKITGRKWEDYIREAILAPLNMTNTYFWAEENKTGLHEIKPTRKKQKRKRDYGFLGSTGIFSTATDLLKFQQAFKSNVIVNDSSRALWAGKHVKLKSAIPNSTDYYSYGLFTTEGENKSIWLRGNEEAWGVSIVYLIQESNTSIIVLSDKEKLVNGEKPHMYISSEIIKRLNE